MIALAGQVVVHNPHKYPPAHSEGEINGMISYCGINAPTRSRRLTSAFDMANRVFILSLDISLQLSDRSILDHINSFALSSRSSAE